MCRCYSTTREKERERVSLCARTERERETRARFQFHAMYRTENSSNRPQPRPPAQALLNTHVTHGAFLLHDSCKGRGGERIWVGDVRLGASVAIRNTVSLMQAVKGVLAGALGLVHHAI